MLTRSIFEFFRLPFYLHPRIRFQSDIDHIFQGQVLSTDGRTSRSLNVILQTNVNLQPTCQAIKSNYSSDNLEHETFSRVNDQGTSCFISSSKYIMPSQLNDEGVFIKSIGVSPDNITTKYQFSIVLVTIEVKVNLFMMNQSKTSQIKLIQSNCFKKISQLLVGHPVCNSTVVLIKKMVDE